MTQGHAGAVASRLEIRRLGRIRAFVRGWLRIGLLLIAATAGGYALPVHAQVEVRVGSGPGCDFPTLPAALEKHPLNQSVTYKLYSETNTVSLSDSLLFDDVDATVIGGFATNDCSRSVSPSARTVITGPADESVLMFRSCSRESSYALENVELRQNVGTGVALSGGGLRLYSCDAAGRQQPMLVMRNSRVVGTVARDGGGIDVLRATLVMHDSAVTNAHAIGVIGSAGHFEFGAGGGLHCRSGEVLLRGNVEFLDNRADGFGGGISLTNCTLSSDGEVGVVTIARNKLNAPLVQSGPESGRGMRSLGGGIYAKSSSLRIGGPEFQVNIKDNATALFPATAIAFPSIVERPSGGGIYGTASSPIVINNALIERNWSYQGAAIQAGEMLDLSDTVVAANFSFGFIQKGGFFDGDSGWSGSDIIGANRHVRLMRVGLVNNSTHCRPLNGTRKENCEAANAVFDFRLNTDASGRSSTAALESVLVAGNQVEHGGDHAQEVRMLYFRAAGATVDGLTMADNRLRFPVGAQMYPFHCPRGCRVRNSLVIPRDASLDGRLGYEPGPEFSCVGVTSKYTALLSDDGVTHDRVLEFTSVEAANIFSPGGYEPNPAFADRLFDRCASTAAGADLNGYQRAVDLPDLANLVGPVDLGAYEQQLPGSQQPVLLEVVEPLSSLRGPLGGSAFVGSTYSATRVNGGDPVDLEVSLQLLPATPGDAVHSRFLVEPVGCSIDPVSGTILRCKRYDLPAAGQKLATTATIAVLDRSLRVKTTLGTIDGSPIADGSEVEESGLFEGVGLPGNADLIPAISGPAAVVPGQQSLSYVVGVAIHNIAAADLPTSLVYLLDVQNLPQPPPDASCVAVDGDGMLCARSLFHAAWDPMLDGAGKTVGYRLRGTFTHTWPVQIEDPNQVQGAPRSFQVNARVVDHLAALNNVATQHTTVSVADSPKLALLLLERYTEGADAYAMVERRGVADIQDALSVALASSSPALVVPSSVVIPGGASTASFPVSPSFGASDVEVTVTANAGSPFTAVEQKVVVAGQGEIFGDGFEN